MSPKFNIDRPKISDDEIKQHQNFSELVERFKQQSLKKARGDESWWQNKKVRYSTVIAGVTVVCTITYFSLFSNQPKSTRKNETLTTQNNTIQSKEPAKQAFIAAPSQKLKTPYSAYKINNAKGGTITHTSSSKIKIPKNSFVDKHGKEIVGDVTIEYKEFHDIGDIIAGGIPMAYDSAGTKYNLETAGMFDIKGTQNGEPVFIKPEKKLDIELASASSEDRFNQYYLDTLERNWKHLKRDVPVLVHSPAKTRSAAAAPSTAKMELLKDEIERVIPKKIDSIKVVYTTRAVSLPKPKEPAKPMQPTPGRPNFTLDGSYDEFPELSAFDKVLFEVGPENKNYSKDLHDITWSDIKVAQGPVKGKNYLLTLSYRSRSEKLIVYPVLSGKDYEKAEHTYDQKLEQYQALAEKRTLEEKRLLAEMQAKQAAYLAEQKKKQEQYDAEKAKMLEKYNTAQQNELASSFNTMGIQVKATRLFRISQFGIFNSDCPHATPKGSSVIPIFISDSKDKIIYPDYLYLVDHSNKTVYSLDKKSGFKLSYEPGSIYSICMFINNQMYLCNKALFKETTEKESNKFMVELMPDNIDNLPEFKKAIEIL